MSPSSQVERLQACLEAIEAGATVEEAVGHFPQARDELLPLLATAHLVRVERPRPAAAWRRDMARDWAGHGVEREAPVPLRHPGRWAVRVVSMAAAVILALGGLVVASADSAPGDRLYQVRRGVERAAAVAGAVMGRPASSPVATEELPPSEDSSEIRSRRDTAARRAPGADTTRDRGRPTAPPLVARAPSRDARSDGAVAMGEATTMLPAPVATVPESAAEPLRQEAQVRSIDEEPPDAEVERVVDMVLPEDRSPAVSDAGSDPDRPPPPAPPAGLAPPEEQSPPPGLAPPEGPPVLPIASPTPRIVGLAPIGPGAGEPPGVVPATGAITGKVIDKHGKPMKRAKVSVYRAADRWTSSRHGPRPVAIVRAESDGSYRVEGLLPDAYLVAVRNPGFFAGETYFPDAPDRWRAEVVEVSSGRDTTDVDIRQRQRRWYEHLGQPSRPKPRPQP